VVSRVAPQTSQTCARSRLSSSDRLFHFPRWSVLNGCPNVPSQCDPSPCGYQWLLSLTHDDDLKYLEALPFYGYLCLVLLVHLSHGGFVFERQRLCQRLLHYSLQLVEGMQVVSQAVIFDEPPIFLLVGGDDGKITFISNRLGGSLFLASCSGHTCPTGPSEGCEARYQH